MITDRMREHGRTGKRAVSKAWILLGGSDRGGSPSSLVPAFLRSRLQGPEA